MASKEQIGERVPQSKVGVQLRGYGLKYSGSPAADLITMIGMSSPRASFDAAYSRRHQPRERHVLKSQICEPGGVESQVGREIKRWPAGCTSKYCYRHSTSPPRSACLHGGASTHICEQRSTNVGIESTAFLSCSTSAAISESPTAAEEERRWSELEA